MTKYNNEMLAHFKAKHLGYMTHDAQKQVEVSDRGFVYKGELIVSIEGLRDMIIEKETVTVGDLENSNEQKTIKKNDARVVKKPKVEEVPVEDNSLETEEEIATEENSDTEETSSDEETKPARRKPGPKPKK